MSTPGDGPLSVPTSTFHSFRGSLLEQDTLDKKSVKVLQLQDLKTCNEYKGNDRVLHSDEHVFLEWKNISYFVPCSRQEKEAHKKAAVKSEGEDSLLRGIANYSSELDPKVSSSMRESGFPEVNSNKVTGLPEMNLVKKGWTTYKQIVTNSCGYVKPKEMVAILGPSGSGKTSLLNVLAQR